MLEGEGVNGPEDARSANLIEDSRNGKKKPSPSGWVVILVFYFLLRCFDLLYVAGLGAFLALDDFELNIVPLLQALVTL